MHSTPDVPSSLPLERWLARLAERTGAPGGGSAAALMLATGAALVSMVGGYSDGDVAARVTTQAGDVRQRLLEAGRADGRASAELGAQLASDAEDRDARLADAAVAAALASMDVLVLGAEALTEAFDLAEVGNPHLRVDIAVALHALRAGIASAQLNVRENAALARRHGADAARVDGFGPMVQEALSALPRIDDLLAQLDDHMTARGGSSRQGS